MDDSSRIHLKFGIFALDSENSFEVMSTADTAAESADTATKSAKGKGKQGAGLKNSGKKESIQVSDNCFDWFDCKAPVNEGEDGVQCEICDGWYHRVCVKLSKQAYEALVADSIDKLNMLHWYCTHCSRGVKRVLTGMAVLEKRQDMMENEISNLKKDLIKISDIDGRVEATTEKVARIEKQVKEMDSSIDKVIETRLKEAVEEKEDKEKRCLNLVLFGIEESGKETAQDRIDTGVRIQDDCVTSIMNVHDIIG